MNSNPVISVKKVSKTYRIHHRRQLLTTSALKWFHPNHPDIATALQDISFEVYPGEILGIIGQNGSGKSTLLKILSSVTKADSGEIYLKGRITSLLELGAGFEPELSGYENIFLYGCLMGLTKKQIRQHLDEIIHFSGLGEFIRDPVRTYSSGMFVRLAMSIALFTDPQILLLDEILGAGDITFQHQCFEKIRTLLSQGMAAILVSHDMSLINHFCDRALVLSHGRTVRIAEADKATSDYSEYRTRQTQLCEIIQNDFRISAGNGTLHVYYQNQPLTSADGCHILFHRGIMKYPSQEAAWEVLSFDKNHFTIQGKWPHWSLSQKWTVTWQTNAFQWRIENSDNINTFTDQMEIQAMISSHYRRYFTSDSTRPIPLICTSNINLESLLMQPHPRRFMAAGEFSSPSPQPGFLMDFSQLPRSGQSQIINGNLFYQCVIISRILPSNALTPSQIRVEFPCDADLHNYFMAHRDIPVCSFGLGSCVFTGESIQIGHNGQILTSGKGLFARIHKDQQEAELTWEAIQYEKALNLRATGISIPIVLDWRFRQEMDCLCWELNLEVLDLIENIAWQAGIESADLKLLQECIGFEPSPIHQINPTTVVLRTSESATVFTPGKYQLLKSKFQIKGGTA